MKINIIKAIKGYEASETTFITNDNQTKIYTFRKGEVVMFVTAQDENKEDVYILTEPLSQKEHNIKRDYQFKKEDFERLGFKLLNEETKSEVDTEKVKNDVSDTKSEVEIV